MPKKRKNAPQRYDVRIEFEGKEYAGSYVIESGMVKVSSPYGSKATQIGGTPADIISRMIFRNILTDAKRKGILREFE